MFSSTGFGSTLSKTAAATPAASSRPRTRSAIPTFTTPASHTRRARLAPSRLAWSPTFATAPTPNTIVVGKDQLTSDSPMAARRSTAAGDGPSRYSDALEVALQLPLGDGALVLTALPVARHEVVIDEPLAQ